MFIIPGRGPAVLITLALSLPIALIASRAPTPAAPGQSAPIAQAAASRDVVVARSCTPAATSPGAGPAG